MGPEENEAPPEPAVGSAGGEPGGDEPGGDEQPADDGRADLERARGELRARAPRAPAAPTGRAALGASVWNRRVAVSY